MKNILVAEDDIKQCENLKKMLHMIDDEFNIYEARDKDGALKISNNVNIDLFFIDVSLKNSSGLNLALDLRKIPEYEFIWIVFLTTHMEYITEAFTKTHCYDYILKPYDKDKIVDMVRRFSFHSKNNSIEKKERKSVFFDLKSGVSMKFYIDEIIFIESSMRTCIVNTMRDSYTLKKISLKKIQELMDCDYIIQSHKSFLVNINYVKCIEKIDSRSSELYFEKSSKKAFLGYKFKNSVLEKLEEK